MDEMNNNLSDGLSCTVQQGPAELAVPGGFYRARVVIR